MFDSDPFSVLVIGDTENGDAISLVYDEDFSDWTVAVARGTDWHQFRISVSEFIFRLFNERNFTSVFPDDWPDEESRIMQYDDRINGPVGDVDG